MGDLESEPSNLVASVRSSGRDLPFKLILLDIHIRHLISRRSRRSKCLTYPGALTALQLGKIRLDYDEKICGWQ